MTRPYPRIVFSLASLMCGHTVALTLTPSHTTPDAHGENYKVVLVRMYRPSNKTREDNWDPLPQEPWLPEAPWLWFSTGTTAKDTPQLKVTSSRGTNIPQISRFSWGREEHGLGNLPACIQNCPLLILGTLFNLSVRCPSYRLEMVTVHTAQG